MSEQTQTTAVATKQDISLKGWLTSPKFKEQVALALPSHLTPDRFLRIALTVTQRNPQLAKCNQESVLGCLLDCSSLGLEPDGRRAHLIPYGDRCTLIIDYKGLIELAKRSGEVRSWKAESVCENDKFTWSNGEVNHKIDWRKPRGAVQCVYSRVINSAGDLDYEVMTLDEIEGIRKRSKAGSSGPWVSDYSEMCKKTVIRRHSKRLTLSPEFIEALEKDYDKPENYGMSNPEGNPSKEAFSGSQPVAAESVGAGS